VKDLCSTAPAQCDAATTVPVVVNDLNVQTAPWIRIRHDPNLIDGSVPGLYRTVSDPEFDSSQIHYQTQINDFLTD
jgi:hypothetical protein